VDFIFVFPEEAEEDQLLTLDISRWICRKRGNVRVHYLTPLPSTPYENACPSAISKKVSCVLGRLAKNGKVTGSWK
jgi:radical SAM superfamily enzyme YgiQ (UPF0313 family)